jgi:hypothetical protein
MKRLLIVLLSMLAFALPAQAAFPEKPIRLVVAFAPGSSTDIVARLIGRADAGRPGPDRGGREQARRGRQHRHAWA